MLRDIVEEWKKQGGECETVTVYCPYCHQGMAAEATLDIVRNDELLKELAIEICQCPEAQYETKRKQRVENVDEKVNALLGKESDSPIDDEILDLIKSMSIHICYEKIKKMSIQLNQVVKVSISMDTNGLLDIKKEIKNISRQKI
ncbi:MAG: hypothetical protein K2I96_06670 [Lachnospiraceae bacterium]|nr:hypothetical protein [Lachnospiraceae bacterium]